MAKEPVFWGHRDEEHLTCVDPDDALEEIIDGYSGEGETTEDVLRNLGEVSVTGFAPETLDRDKVATMALDGLTERLDETYGDTEGAGGDPATDKMREAALVFADVVIAEYCVWLCEPVCEHKVNALEWVKENRQHWLEETPK